MAGAARHADRLIRWPDDFGRRFAIMVDTEEEFDWSRPPSREERSVAAIAALPSAHHRFAARGIAMTYLIDHPVAADARARDTIAPLLVAGSTVGAQLHPWVNHRSSSRRCPGQLRGNLATGVEAASWIACSTRSSRVRRRAADLSRGALRVGSRHARAAGGTRHRDRHVDARAVRLHRRRRRRFQRDRRGAVWLAPGVAELPLSTISPGDGAGRKLASPAVGARCARTRVMARAGLLSRVPLTPEGVPLREALEAVRRAIDDDVRLLNFSFHSPSLVPGHTPYVRDARDLAAFYHWWDAVLDLLDRLGVAPREHGGNRRGDHPRATMTACQRDPGAVTSPARGGL